MTGALLAAALVLKSQSGSFKQTLLRDWKFLLLPHPPLDFTARSYDALFPGAGTLGSWSGLRLGLLASQVSLLVFICHM